MWVGLNPISWRPSELELTPLEEGILPQDCTIELPEFTAYQIVVEILDVLALTILWISS